MFVHDTIRMSGNKFGHRPAVVTEQRTVTFGELQDSCWRLANALGAVAQPGDRVAVLAENLPEYVECYYGVPAAGLALTFLNYRLHPREWAWIINDAEARVVFVQGRYAEALHDHLDETPSVEHVVVIDDGTPISGSLTTYDDLLAAASAVEPDVVRDDAEIAWLLYTSGTTGFPKGAMLSHRNVTTGMLNMGLSLEAIPDERSLIAFPLCHIAGFTVPLTHLRGGRVVLPPAFDPEGWMRMVDEHRITSTSMAPTMLNMILQDPAIDSYDLGSMRNLGYGAAAMPVEVLKSAIDRFGPVVVSGFGMTELAGNVLTFSKAAHARAVAGEAHLLASCGVPQPLAEVKVVDEAFVECPHGEVGEIVVRGEQTLSGYFGNEQATHDAYVDGWFRTGDLARRDEEGFFYVVDRRKDMINTGGENVYSREVEEALYAHPAVSEVAVVGIPDPTWGENVTAVVVLRPGAAATEQEIVDVVRDRLAGYKTPKRVHFVDELPKTVTGKIVKREVRERLVEAGGRSDS